MITDHSTEARMTKALDRDAYDRTQALQIRLQARAQLLQAAKQALPPGSPLIAEIDRELALG